MEFKYSVRKDNIINILKETILIQYKDKFGIHLSSISENKCQYEEDIKCLCERCKTKNARRWVRKMTWDVIVKQRRDKYVE